MKQILAILIICLSVSQIYSQNKSTIATLDLEATGVSRIETQAIGNRIRQEIYLSNQFTVVERDEMEAILKEQGFQLSGCTSSECAVEAGKLLGVQYMIAGSLDKLGELYTIHLRMIDVQSGEVLAMAGIDCECPIEKVAVELTKEVVRELLASKDESSSIIIHYVEKRWRKGIRIGYNSAKIKNAQPNTTVLQHDWTGSGAIGGFCGGIFLLYGFSNRFAIQPELLYSIKGGESYGQPWQIHYIEIPLLFKFKLFDSNGVIPNFLLGGYGAIPVFSKQNIVEINGSVLDIFPHDFGFIFVLSLDIPVDLNQLGFEIRYSSGVRDINIGPIYGGKNQVFSFLSGYSF